MSLPTVPSANLQSVLDAALESYVKQTGVDITKHPSAEKLQNCHSPEDVIQLLSEGETAFKDYRDKYRNLIGHLRPVVRIVYAFSGILGDAFQPTKAMFVGIDVLLSVRISHLCLSHL
jgi:fungal STAND N-terminal Goodbye domain